MYGPSMVIEGNKLKIVLDRGDRLDLLNESYDEHKSSLTLLPDVLERLVSNGYLEWVDAEEIGALTDAPILKCLTDDKIYWYPNYAITDPVDDWILDGVVEFVTQD